jgi:transcriptional regulator with XRE-family HTH domain
MSARALAEKSGVAQNTIQRFESERGGVLATTLDRLQQTLEANGVVFISADANGGPGVRLRDGV